LKEPENWDLARRLTAKKWKTGSQIYNASVYKLPMARRFKLLKGMIKVHGYVPPAFIPIIDTRPKWLLAGIGVTLLYVVFS
jgi:hypothetical protein